MLKLHEDTTSFRTLFIFIVIAYLFSLSLRFIWVDTFKNTPQFRWNNELMINNNDGYFFAEGARDILQGHHEQNDLSPVEGPLSKLTAFFSKIFPVSFETLILYMPAVIGSLVVIPLILIGRALHQTTMGFIAALVGSIANSYYNRTMMGYYDTDMLNVVFPVLEMFSLILAITHQRNRYLIPITVSIALYQWWYPQAYTLDTGLFGIIIVYALLFDRKNIYLYKIALFILIGILALPFTVKVALAVGIFTLFHFQKELSTKLFLAIFAVVIALYFSTGGFTPILGSLKSYLGIGSKNVIAAASSLHYYDVVSTVREAGHIPFSVFAERISGHTVTFIIACVGYLMALIAYRPLVVTLPLVGLGFIAMSAGLRFTIYAVPAMALGFGFFAVWISQRIQNSWFRYATLMILSIGAIYPNYLHIREYLTPTVFTAQEIEILEQFHKIASREDYVVSWWDYGYPLRYYSDVKTWVDGGKHSGDVNYPASFVLSAQDGFSAAHMMRLFTEYTEKGFSETNKTSNDFETMIKKEHFQDPNDFITALALPEYKMPSKTRDVYLCLPLRMMEIFPTITLFSNLDLKSGKSLSQPFFYSSQNFKDMGATIDLGQGVSINKTNSTLKIGAKEVPIKTFYQVGYDNDKKVQVNQQPFASDGLNVVFMASYGQFLVLDDYFFNSTYIQMFVFEHYDHNLFEPVILNPMMKLYKLKI